MIIILLSVFSFSIFTNDLIMENNIIFAQAEPPLPSSPSSQSSDPLTTAQSLLKTLDENAVEALKKTNTIESPLPSSPSLPSSQSSDPLTTSQSILKTLVDDAVEALKKTNTTKTLLNLNIVLQALKESNENSSSIEATKLLLNDAIQALNNNDTTRASAYIGLASQQLVGVEPSKVDTQSTTSNTNTIASKNYLLYENPTVGIKIKYPDNWSLRTYSYNPALNNTVAGFYSPSKTASEIGNISGVTGLFVPYVDIFVFSSKNMSLDEIIDSRIDRIQNSTYSLIDESKPFTLKGNQPAYTLIYSINSGKEELFKKMQVYTIYSNKVYLITFTSQEALFAEYKPTIQEMVNSFELLKRTDLL
jgi:PsbP-like protein